MLRRVKTDVVSELTRKTEITVHCKLSSRQQAFYQAIKNKISLAELFDNNRGHLNEKKILNLMNIVIQLRKVSYIFLLLFPKLIDTSKLSEEFHYFFPGLFYFVGGQVCNHPELFERSEGSTFHYFGEIPISLLPPPFGELEDVHYSGGHNPIIFKVLFLSVFSYYI